MENLIKETNIILPFTLEKYPTSFTIGGEYGFKTFTYSNKNDCERNRLAFCNKYKEVMGKDLEFTIIK